MGDVNRVFLVGNVGKEPEVRTFDNGGEVVKFPVATNKKWKSKDGEQHAETTWHQVQLNNNAAKMGQYIHKGDKVCIEGEIKVRKHNDKIYTDIVVGFGGSVNIVSSATPKKEDTSPLPTTKAGLNDDIPF